MARWTPASARRAAAALAALLAAPANGAGDSAQLEFRRHREPVAAYDASALQRIAPAAAVRVFEPYERREVAFRALPFERVLDAVYGESWRRDEELLFTCRDGYQPTVPVSRVLAHRAWLAFARDGADFSIRKLESGRYEQVPLGPFYLIWENLDDAQVRRDGDYGWPYQLVGVELIRSGERFPRMAPPTGAAPQVVRGFREFRAHCSRCHPLNGDGGVIGPELNARASPAGHRDADWLRRWIDAPAEIAPTARMEPLNPDLPDRGAVIDAIIAYLQAMAAAPGGARPASDDR